MGWGCLHAQKSVLDFFFLADVPLWFRDLAESAWALDVTHVLRSAFLQETVLESPAPYIQLHLDSKHVYHTSGHSCRHAPQPSLF